MGDLSLGETNHADNGTELTGGTLARDWGGNNYIFKVDGATISPIPPGGVMGIEASDRQRSDPRYRWTEGGRVLRWPSWCSGDGSCGGRRNRYALWS